MATRRKKSASHRGANLAVLLARHKVALDTMSHGLCMFDADYRVVLFNRRYLELLNLSPKVVRNGLSFREVLEHSAARGNFPVDELEEKWRERRDKLATGKPFTLRQPLRNGVIIAFHFRPMLDGGWVSISEDMGAEERLQAELRLQIERLDEAVANMSHGLCMFGADERLIVCNEQYLSHYELDANVVKPGVTHREVINHWISRGHQPGSSAEEFYQRRMREIRSNEARVGYLTRRDGRVIEAISRSTPEGGWVSANEDVTERRRAEMALTERNILLDAALENMAQGLCMVDEHFRIIVCNRRYLEIFGFSSDVAKPGMLMRDVLAYSIALGNHPDASAEQLYGAYVSALRAGANTVFRSLPDGRTIEINHSPMTNGGFVLTYEDVTERHEAQRALAAAKVAAERAEEEARKAHTRLVDALDAVPEGLAVFDPQDRYVLWNRRYAEIYPESRDVLRPGVTFEEVVRAGLARGQYPEAIGREEEWLRERLALHAQPQYTHEQHLPGDRWLRIDERRTADGGSIGVRIDITDLKRSEARSAYSSKKTHCPCSWWTWRRWSSWRSTRRPANSMVTPGSSSSR
jgi:PAS domain S-box-containing protein